MLVHKEEYVTVRALQDVDAGDAIIFYYENFSATTRTEAPVIKSNSNPAESAGKYCHGVTVADAYAGDLVTVRLATAGTLCVKTDWTGTLSPGAAIYPGLVTDGVLATTGDAADIIGLYVGSDVLPESDSGSCIEILILRLSSVYSPV